MLMPYLRFNGNCEAAFRWYEKVFEGKIQHLSYYPKTAERLVMHTYLMLSDASGISGGDTKEPLVQGDAIAIQVHFANVSVAERVFRALAEKGEIFARLAVNPPPDDSGVSGSVKDQYGVSWIVSAPIK
ncbi:VOC family protein [Enterococcus florum]|uniref:VOC family protein n=1 Tax=Enterococcus florum TaxID=2480627 RepID=A0A4P5PAC1_9ENTE|nr:VOC family protein [Enterococcus florum]GCF93344.1 VOC family protein [Enterococcus florum]